MPQNILVETKGRVGIIRFNRPQALNALNAALVEELNAAIDQFEIGVAQSFRAFNVERQVTHAGARRVVLVERGLGRARRLRGRKIDHVRAAGERKEYSAVPGIFFQHFKAEDIHIEVPRFSKVCGAQ